MNNFWGFGVGSGDVPWQKRWKSLNSINLTLHNDNNNDDDDNWMNAKYVMYGSSNIVQRISANKNIAVNDPNSEFCHGLRSFIRSFVHEWFPIQNFKPTNTFRSNVHFGALVSFCSNQRKICLFRSFAHTTPSWNYCTHISKHKQTQLFDYINRRAWNTSQYGIYNIYILLNKFVHFTNAQPTLEFYFGIFLAFSSQIFIVFERLRLWLSLSLSFSPSSCTYVSGRVLFVSIAFICRTTDRQYYYSQNITFHP